MLCKDWHCLCPSPLKYTIYYEKSAVFSPCSHTSRWSISDWSCETKKVDLYKTLDLCWRAFCLRNMDERFHHQFTCVLAEPTSSAETSTLGQGGQIAVVGARVKTVKYITSSCSFKLGTTFLQHSFPYKLWPNPRPLALC